MKQYIIIVGGKMNIDRTNIKKVASKTVDIAVDATEVIIEHIPVVATKIVQRTGPYVAKGVKIATKTIADTLYKLAFK